MTELRIGCMTAATEVNGTIRVDGGIAMPIAIDPTDTAIIVVSTIFPVN